MNSLYTKTQVAMIKLWSSTDLKLDPFSPLLKVFIKPFMSNITMDNKINVNRYTTSDEIIEIPPFL